MNKTLIAFSLLAVFSLQSMEMEKENKATLESRLKEVEETIQAQEEKDKLYCNFVQMGEFEIADKLVGENLVNHNSTIVHELMHDAIGNKYDTSAVILKLLHNGTDPNYIYGSMHQGVYSPLYLAAQLGKLKIVNILLQYKASVHLGTIQGDKPVLAAAENKHWSVTEVLLAHDPYEISNTLHWVLNRDDQAYEPIIQNLTQLAQKYKKSKE